MITSTARSGFLRALLCGMTLCIFTANSHGGSWQRNLAIGGFNNVHLYTPDTRSAIGDGKALLIVLHGCVQPINNYLTANLEDAAEEFGMVVAVPDAMNKAGFSCWSYWQGTRSRTAGDYKNLIQLANTLSGDAARDIDPHQVYIAGVSSGASFANTTACLAPDVFAGMGISAGPSIGTSSGGAISTCERADVTSRCRSYAGGYAEHFDTQITSIAHGDADTTVNQCYNQQNAEGMAGVYGVSQMVGTNTRREGNLSAQETLWKDGRVSMLWLNGVSHAWSGGAGANGSYISGASINYARYLGKFFRDNNQRVDRNQGPVLSGISIEIETDSVLVNGTAVDSDGSVRSVRATFAGDSTSSVDGGVDSNDVFSLASGTLADDLYVISVIATDNDGAPSEPYTDTVRIGPEPPTAAPTLSDVSAAVSGQCATVTGTVIDENQDLHTVAVTFSIGQVGATIDGTGFSAQRCNLPGGEGSATVTATDLEDLSSTTTVDFTIDAGITATLDNHIASDRLDYLNYSNCYLKYGSDPFRLDEFSVSGGRCQWRDSDASCAGPQADCSTGDNGGNDNDGDGETCTEQSAYNYSHKVGGRAYSTGNPLAPDYFAAGSDDPLPGSTWGQNTLHSDNGSDWHLGACP